MARPSQPDRCPVLDSNLLPMGRQAGEGELRHHLYLLVALCLLAVIFWLALLASAGILADLQNL